MANNFKIITARSVLILIIYCAGCANCNATGWSITRESFLDLPDNCDEIKSVCSGRIVYNEAENGDIDETSMIYLFALTGVSQEPIIFDSIDGQVVEFVIHKQSDGAPLLLFAYYHSGVNNYNLRAYAFGDGQLYPLNWHLSSSNLGWIHIEGRSISIRNSDRTPSDSWIIEESTYEITGKECRHIADRVIDSGPRPPVE